MNKGFLTKKAKCLLFLDLQHMLTSLAAGKNCVFLRRELEKKERLELFIPALSAVFCKKHCMISPKGNLPPAKALFKVNSLESYRCRHRE